MPHSHRWLHRAFFESGNGCIVASGRLAVVPWIIPLPSSCAPLAHPAVARSWPSASSARRLICCDRSRGPRAGHMLNQVLAAVVPDVDAVREVRPGLHRKNSVAGWPILWATTWSVNKAETKCGHAGVRPVTARSSLPYAHLSPNDRTVTRPPKARPGDPMINQLDLIGSTLMLILLTLFFLLLIAG